MKIIFKPVIFLQFLLGVYSGLPLLLIGSTLQAWMRGEGVDLKTIGIFGIVGMPYTLKFLWSPLLDRFKPPFLGRRRGWLLIFQIGLVITLAVMASLDPSSNIWFMGFIAFLVSFFSASQDIVIDSFRIEILSKEELALGSSLYVNGYRVALIISGALALYMADRIPWEQVYYLMSIIMLSGIVITFIMPDSPIKETPQSLKDAVIQPFVEYFKRKDAILVLFIILFYKIGDSMAAHMTMPLYLDLGFTKTEVAIYAKGIGLFCTIAGGLVGGIIMVYLDVKKSMWFFGGLQMISTAGFSVLAMMGKKSWLLAAVIGFENLASGLGTAAFVVFIATLINKKFTATQSALLTSLMGVPRVVATMPTGWMVATFGYQFFFIFCTLIALPGLWLIKYYNPQETQE